MITCILQSNITIQCLTCMLKTLRSDIFIIYCKVGAFLEEKECGKLNERVLDTGTVRLTAFNIQKWETGKVKGFHRLPVEAIQHVVLPFIRASIKFTIFLTDFNLAESKLLFKSTSLYNSRPLLIPIKHLRLENAEGVFTLSEECSPYELRM
nr:PREDICTED: uncharacterized protein LOC105662595 [Megachile rotundata]